MPRKNTRRMRRTKRTRRKQRGGIHTVLANKNSMYAEMLTASEYRRLSSRDRYSYEIHVILPQYRHVKQALENIHDEETRRTLISRLLYLSTYMFEHALRTITWVNHPYTLAREFDGQPDDVFVARLNAVATLIMGIENKIYDIHASGYDEIYA